MAGVRDIETKELAELANDALDRWAALGLHVERKSGGYIYLATELGRGHLAIPVDEWDLYAQALAELRDGVDKLREDAFRVGMARFREATRDVAPEDAVKPNADQVARLRSFGSDWFREDDHGNWWSPGGEHLGPRDWSEPHRLIFDPEPPATVDQNSGEPLCRDCYEWRPYTSGQAHFGYAWWRTCRHGCDHAHHLGEVWMA